MNEFLLLSVTIILLIAGQWYLRNAQWRTRLYTKITAGTILLSLIWFSNDAAIPVRVLMTIIVLTSVLREIQAKNKVQVEE